MFCSSSRLVPTAIPVSITRGTITSPAVRSPNSKEVTQNLARFTPQQASFLTLFDDVLQLFCGVVPLGCDRFASHADQTQ